jgi:hypothetical protein
MERRRRVATWVGIATLLAAGCGDDGPTTAEATADVCDARDDLEETMTEVERLDPTDGEKLSDARESLADDVDELSDAGQQLAEATWDDVESAADDVESALGDIDADTSFREANERLSTARDRLAEAWNSFLSDVDCGS